MSTPRRPAAPRSSGAPITAIRVPFTPEPYGGGSPEERPLHFPSPGEVAQLVEHAAENRGVAGSSPALATWG